MYANLNIFFRFVKCIHFPGRPFCVEFVNPHRVNLTKQILKQLQQVILLKFGMFISLHMKTDLSLFVRIHRYYFKIATKPFAIEMELYTRPNLKWPHIIKHFTSNNNDSMPSGH